MFRIDDQRALVTGASGGIGKAIAQRPVKQGAFCSFTGTRMKNLQEVQKNLEAKHIAPCDLSDKGSGKWAILMLWKKNSEKSAFL